MRSTLKTQLLFIFLIFCLTILTSAQAGLEAGKKAPAFKLPSLVEKKEVALSDFLGKIVVLHLWKCK